MEPNWDRTLGRRLLIDQLSSRLFYLSQEITKALAVN
jgi:hypothetical protein